MSDIISKPKPKSSSSTDLDATTLTAAETFRTTFSGEDDVETGVGIASSSSGNNNNNGGGGGNASADGFADNNSSSNQGHSSTNNVSSRASAASRPRWLIAGTIGILFVIALSIALSSRSSRAGSIGEQSDAATTATVASVPSTDDGGVNDDLDIKTIEIGDNGSNAAMPGSNNASPEVVGGATTMTAFPFSFASDELAPNLGEGNDETAEAIDTDDEGGFKPELEVDGVGDSALLNPNFPIIVVQQEEEGEVSSTTTTTATTTITSTTSSTSSLMAIENNGASDPPPSKTEPENNNDVVVNMFTNRPTSAPTNVPTKEPTTMEPSKEPTPVPTYEPTKQPAVQPALYQWFLQGDFSTMSPSSNPTPEPTSNPTKKPSNQPTSNPTNEPTPNPTAQPTKEPTNQQPALYEAFLSGNFGTQRPTPNPTPMPSALPTSNPTPNPTNMPTAQPTVPANPYFMGDEFYTFTEDGVTLQVSKGLSVRLLAKTGSKVQYANGDESKDSWHTRSDAAGIIPECPDTPTECGYAYASNSEEGDGDGGVYGLYFDKDGNVLEYKALLKGTTDNCGGGISPWNTWISCEEYSDGQCWQIDPYTGEAKETELGGNGGRYESVAVDNRNPAFPVFFTTEDDEEGALRRFQAQGSGWDALHSNGKTTFLNILSDNTFEWTDDEDTGRSSASKHFPNTEGIQVHDGKVYFMAKELKRMLILDLETNTYTTEQTGKKFYGEGDFGEQPDQNLFGATRKYLYFTEDGGKRPGVYARFGTDGTYFTMFEADLPEEDETIGIALSPDHKKFYAGIQDLGYIYEFTRDDGLPFE